MLSANILFNTSQCDKRVDDFCDNGGTATCRYREPCVADVGGTGFARPYGTMQNGVSRILNTHSTHTTLAAGLWCLHPFVPPRTLL